MRIPKVVERISFQGIDLFLNCITGYNEDLVKLFYTGVAEKFEGFRFFCNIGNDTVEVNDDVWKSLFEISPLSSPTDLKITDSVYAPDYDFGTSLNKMLRKPFAPKVVQSIIFPTNVTIDQLKPLDRILHWIVTHILRPKQGSYSRVDKAKVHLVYVLKHKIKINWPHYIASRIFALKESGRGTALCYPSFIQSVLHRANVSVQEIPYKSISIHQEVCQKTLSLIGYTWDRSARLYKTRQPVPDTNARPVEGIEDDDDDDNNDDDEDEQCEEEEENNEVHSQPVEHDH